MTASMNDDRVYFAERERLSREMAERAADPAVQQIHQQFAEAYARRRQSAEFRPISL